MSALPHSQSSQAAPGLSQAIASFAPGLPNPTKLFAAEMERAVERQGGEVAVDHRLGSVTDARRANRRAGFERGRSEPNTTEAPDRPDATLRDGRDAELAIVDRADALPREPIEATGTPTRDEAPLQARSSNATEARPAAPAEPSHSATPSGASVPAGAPVAPAAIAEGGVAAANGARSAAAARPADAVAAFLQGARGDSPESGARKAGAPVPARPDAELVEHAAEVLKQIRLSLRNGGREVMVQLSPSELGRIQIRMRSRGGSVSALVRVESRETLELLERQTPELRATLAQGGLEPESIELELAFGGFFSESDADTEANPKRPASHDTRAEDAAGAMPELLERTNRARIDESGVDLYV